MLVASPDRIAPVMPDIRLCPEREERIPVEGGHIYVRINGDLDNGRPPTVMVHGGPGSAHWYFLNATALADERAVILYDQLDSGRSDNPNDPANWRVERFVDELDAIRAHLGIERWHVLGTSWGGTVVLEYGARQPEALAGLILQSPLVSTASWLADANRLKDAMPADIRAILHRGDTPDAPSDEDCTRATEAFYRRHVQLADPPQEIAAYRAALPRSFNAGIYNHMWGRAEFTASGRSNIMTAWPCSTASTAPAPCSSPAKRTKPPPKPWPNSPGARVRNSQSCPTLRISQ